MSCLWYLHWYKHFQFLSLSTALHNFILRYTTIYFSFLLIMSPGLFIVFHYHSVVINFHIHTYIWACILCTPQWEFLQSICLGMEFRDLKFCLFTLTGLLPEVTVPVSSPIKVQHKVSLLPGRTFNTARGLILARSDCDMCLLCVFTFSRPAHLYPLLAVA